MPTRSALASLLSGTETSYRGDADTVVTGIVYDSREVQPGDVFVAVPGFVHDGLRFVTDAVAAGAVAIVAEADPNSVNLAKAPTVWARVHNARAILAPMAAAFYNNPSHDLTVVGVTGTNGKTTVAALCQALLEARGPVGFRPHPHGRIGRRSSKAFPKSRRYGDSRTDGRPGSRTGRCHYPTS